MSKYERKLLEIVNHETIIYKLTREIIKETKVSFLDIIFDNVFSLMETIKELNKKTAYYLIIDNGKFVWAPLTLYTFVKVSYTKCAVALLLCAREWERPITGISYS